MKALQFAPGDRGLTRLLERLFKRVEEQHDQLDRLAREMEVEDVVRGLDLSEERTILATVQQRAGDAVELQRQRTLGKVLDEVYFRVEIEPGVGGLRGTSVVDATTFSYTFEDFPAAAVTVRRRARALRSLWPKTAVRLNLWYTSPVGSTNAFSINYSVRQLDVGMNLSAASLIINSTFTVPGPAVANDVLFATYRDPGLVLPVPRVCQFSIRRSGPDANANDFRFILAEFVLEETA